VPKLAPPQRIRISQGVTRGLLVHRVEPSYPPLARAARIQGEVVLSAVISINGDIQNLQLVSGHPMLVPAAITAVRQWRYKPYLLNGQPVEVETTITVIFSLTS
jgi:protein TonB